MTQKPEDSGQISRVVALGASNLTRGFQTVVSTARAAWGPGTEVFAALGHGRSYGAPSRLLVRELPGILQCGLWRELESRPPAATRGLITDVGNDILYAFSVDEILKWVAEAIGRLRRVTVDIIVTGLPLDSIRRLSGARFLLFRSLLVPSCRLSLSEALERAERVDAGLAELSLRTGARFFRMKPSWYGVDPVHVRPSLWRPAWGEILGVPPEPETEREARWEGLNLYLMRPERRRLFGIEQFTPQAGVPLRSGGLVWLY